jgi:hypothetical protein
VATHSLAFVLVDTILADVTISLLDTVPVAPTHLQVTISSLDSKLVVTTLAVKISSLAVKLAFAILVEVKTTLSETLPVFATPLAVSMYFMGQQLASTTPLATATTSLATMLVIATPSETTLMPWVGKLVDTILPAVTICFLVAILAQTMV